MNLWWETAVFKISQRFLDLRAFVLFRKLFDFIFRVLLACFFYFCKTAAIQKAEYTVLRFPMSSQP